MAKTQREIARRLREADARRWTQEAVGSLLGVAQRTVSDWFTNSGDAKGKSEPAPDARVKVTPPALTADARRWTQEAVGALLGVARETVRDWFTNGGDAKSKSQPPDARVKVTPPALTADAKR